MISRTSNPYHNTGLSRIPSTPSRAITAPAGTGLGGRSAVKGILSRARVSPCTAVEYGKDATILVKGLFLSSATGYGTKKNFLLSEWPFSQKRTIRLDHSSAVEEPI